MTTFAWALEQLHAGYWVARQAWGGQKHVECNERRPLYAGRIYESVISGQRMPWLPDHETMQAQDWMIVRQEPIQHV